jgi:hypothetical protein
VKYAYLKKHSDEFSVSRMCSLLAISRRADYDWLQRHSSANELEDKLLMQLMQGDKTKVVPLTARAVSSKL